LGVNAKQGESESQPCVVEGGRKSYNRRAD